MGASSSKYLDLDGLRHLVDGKLKNLVNKVNNMSFSAPDVYTYHFSGSPSFVPDTSLSGIYNPYVITNLNFGTAFNSSLSKRNRVWYYYNDCDTITFAAPFSRMDAACESNPNYSVMAEITILPIMSNQAQTGQDGGQLTLNGALKSTTANVGYGKYYLTLGEVTSLATKTKRLRLFAMGSSSPTWDEADFVDFGYADRPTGFEYSNFARPTAIKVEIMGLYE